MEMSPQAQSAFYAGLEPIQIELPQLGERKPPTPGNTGSGIVAKLPAAGSGAFGLPANTFHGPGDAPPGTTVSDEGGPRMNHPMIAPLFWGAAWNSPSTQPSASTLMQSIGKLFADWSDGTSYFDGLYQYGVISDIGGVGVVIGTQAAVITSPEPPNNFSSSDVESMIGSLMNEKPNTYGSYNGFLYMVFMPPGVVNNNPAIAGEHLQGSWGNFFSGATSSPLAWVEFRGPSNGSEITRIFSHELIEGLTDPTGEAIQVNPRNSSSWNEICDVCRSAEYVNGVYVTSYFSAQDGACIIPTPPPPPPPPLPAGSYQIDCVIHSIAPHSEKEYIAVLGGPRPGGTRWELGVATVVELIQSGSCTFYTDEDGRRADVTVQTSSSGWPYLMTVADGFTPNNLSALPACQ
jgi:hypothetical protein